MEQFHWTEPPRNLQIDRSQVQIWIARLDDQDPANFWPCLSLDERQRADRMIKPELAHRFVVGRGILRFLLSAYLRLEPQDLVIQYGTHGKPYLAGENADRLSFNLSHSNDLAAYGFTRGQQIGVDVEKMSANIDLESVAAAVMSSAELVQLAACDKDDKLRFFYQLWTCKEAVLKWHGIGFNQSMKSIQMESFELESPLFHVLMPDGSRRIVQRLKPLEGYAGAVAV